MGDGSEWLTEMVNLMRIERFDLVVPCNETSLLPLHRHRDTLSEFARLAIPGEPAITAFFDKHETRELAKRLKVPVAPGRLVHPDDTAEKILAEFGMPVVIKPRRSYSIETLAVRGKVHVLDKQQDVARLLSDCNPDDTLIEQFFIGHGVGVSILASRGRILQFFQHQRAHEIGGASFYRFSAPLMPELGRACEAIVDNLGYTGLAMFEFKLKPNGGWALLEVNARPWGSMPLPLALGIDFPYRWFRLLTDGEETPAVGYPAGVFSRNLVPDLHNLLIEARERRLERAATVWFMIKKVAEMRHLVSGREVNDLLVRDDLRPGFVELRDVAGSICRRVAGTLPGANFRRQHRAHSRLARAMRNLAGQAEIIFVCQGNICRSPFAEALLRAHRGPFPMVVRSAGVLPFPDRQTPPFGIAAASDYDIDLSLHRSTWLNRQMAKSASLLVVFDELTRNSVLDRYPDLKRQVVLLGDFTGLGQISDPIDGDLNEFRKTYAQINEAITTLIPLLERTANPAVGYAKGR